MPPVEPRLTTAVIGSGPAGVAAAQALCDMGHKVVMIDAGDKIETGRMSVFEALAQLEPEQWPPELAQRARNAFPVDIKQVPLKPAYGSLFPYALDDPDLPITCKNAETLPSLAYGGLSNAWGASILPFRRQDIADWPISLDQLEPHYKAVLRFVPIAAERDELSEILPLYTDAPAKLLHGPQTENLLDHLRRHAAALQAAGFYFGASRLAITASAGHPNGCRYSGMCLYGCPYGSIYNSSHTLEKLVRAGNIDYRGGIYVDRLDERDGLVTIDFHRRGRPAETGRMIASRVFVACGPISSTRLILDSTGRTRHSRRLQDSQYFIVPMLTPRAAPVRVATQGNTLAQVFIELEDMNISKRTMHLQLYGYNDLMLSALARRLPVGSARLERVLQPIFGRLVVIQGYLHSSESPGLTMYHDAQGVRVVGDNGAIGAARVRKLVRHLAATGRPLGMFPIPHLTQVGGPGKSNHIGGSLPMRREPGELETDTLGRLPDWNRVHVVDASIFPSVPATTVTISVMANAHRIATAAARAGA